MKRRHFLKTTGLAFGALTMPKILQAQEGEKLPNIIWITSEDNSPLLGCYGDDLARTPNLDTMAAEGVCYDRAFANAPVCAPARSTIITGMHASSLGTVNMRSQYPVPPWVKPFPFYLRQQGYYCTNNHKKDYNIADMQGDWDESSPQAHYKNRKPGQPFFAIFNLGQSHESAPIKRDKPQTNPDKVKLPAYHPDTPGIRENHAKYYDCVSSMDFQAGRILKELEESGLADDTIVIYYADHGGVMTRSKRFVYHSGTWVPLIVRFGKNCQHLASAQPGERTDRLVSFVDLAPTVISLAGMEAPEHMEGCAFLGQHAKPALEYVHLFRNRTDEQIDTTRAITDGEFRYIRNFEPHHPRGRRIRTLFQKIEMTELWKTEYEAGRCNDVQSRFWEPKVSEELYKIDDDPDEVNNLVGDKAHADTLERMRKALHDWLLQSRDANILPEGEIIDRCTTVSPLALCRQTEFPYERMLIAAETASDRDKPKMNDLIDYMSDDERAVRYWGAMGCAALGKEAMPARKILIKRLQDQSGAVRMASAEALCRMDQIETAMPVLLNELDSENRINLLHAVWILYELGDKVAPWKTELKTKEKNMNHYSKRLFPLVLQNAGA